MASELSLTPIGDPYPVPAVGTVYIQRRPVQPVGIVVRLAGKNSVMVHDLTDDSLLHGTPIRIGLEILAINGEAVHSTEQATRLIKNNIDIEFTTFDPQANKTPFCYIEVSPTCKTNPGIAFDSCFSRTLVMISDVFVGLAKTRLRVGDIVLAVNGIPVWKPEEADKEQLAAARASKALVLYCVDMEALRDFFVSRARVTHMDGRTAVIQKHTRNQYQIKERDCVCTATVNNETLLFDDTTGWDHRIKGSTGQYPSKHLYTKTSYARVCAPTLQGINDLMRTQLQRLKAKVVAHAWKFSLESNEGDITAYAVPSAPAAPVEIVCDHGFGPGSDVPLATAVAVAATDDSSVEEGDRVLSI